MQDLVESYVDWIRESTSLREVGGGWHEIVTPFLNHKNDMIELYLRKDNGQIILSDGGNTINELNLSGLDIEKSKKRSSELESILQSFGIRKNGGNEISVSTDVKRFPEVKHRMIQAILAIDDMHMLTEPRVQSFFIEDVADYFELNEVVYVKDTIFTGKSGFIHKFDFALPKIRNRPETAIKAIPYPRKDRIESFMWMIEDTKSIRETTQGLVILNDAHDIAPDIYEALRQYQIPYLNWSQRGENLNQLKVAA